MPEIYNRRDMFYSPKNDDLIAFGSKDKAVEKGVPYSQIITAPGFGQVVVHSSKRKRTFNFKANGSNERQGLADLYQYFADELAAGRRVGALMGAGDYGFDGNGLTQEFAASSTGLVWYGMGSEVTRIGYVGNTESGNNWRIAEWEPETSAIKSVIGITQTAGVATCNITSHGAVLGETVRIYSSDQSEYNGLQIVTGITDADNFTFAVDSGTVTPATGAITCAIHSEFLRDFAICNMQLIDTNSAAHAGTTEETHGIGFSQVIGARLQNIWADSVGDEAIELVYAENFEVSSFKSKGTPSEEQTGGGAISIKNGCHNGLVDKFIIGNTGSTSNNTYGVNFKNVVYPEHSSDITVSNGFIINPVTAGIKYNTSSSGISDIDVSGVTVIGGVTGVATSGSVNILSDIRMSRLTLREQTEQNVSLTRTAADAKDITISDSILDGELLPDVSASTCVNANGTNVLLLNNTYKNARNGVTGGSQVRNLKVLGGRMINIGNAVVGATTFNQYVYDQDTTKSGVVDGLTIVDGKCKTVGFRALKTIKNIDFVGTTVQPANWIGQDIGNFENNKNVPHNVQMGDDGGKCIDNEFTHTASGGNGAIRLNNISGAVVMGNTAPNLATGDGIEEAAGSDSNLVAFNNMNGRPTNLVGAVSIANALSNI